MSNGLTYLSQQVPEYSEAATYVDVPAVRDRGLITASGFSNVEFAVEIMAERKISELPVVDPAGHPVGLIDITDVVALLPEAGLPTQTASSAKSAVPPPKLYT